MSGPRSPSGSTTVAGVIGDPVTHSLSPVLNNAAFEAAGLDWVYVAFPVPPGRGAAAVRSMATLGLAGLSVTMPHKQAAAEACSHLSPAARRLQSVNVVALRPDGALYGDSCDGEGFMRSLADEGIEVGSSRAVVIGAGGAARAVALALQQAGAHVTVAARRPEAAKQAAALTGADAGGLDGIESLVGRSELVVNATSLGMDGASTPFDPSWLGPGHTVADLVYSPRVTPLLAGAAERGARTVEGLGMLVHQAALAFTLWTGLEAPLEVMRATAANHR